ncbi:MAG TPA: hypothetical protein VI341_02265 [Actinomycetota bacterium]
MGLIIVFAIAVAVGVIVFRLTGGGEVGVNEEPTAGVSAGAASTRLQVSPDTAIPVVTARRSWHSRLNGALGLVIAIGVGAVAIALTIYGIGMLIARILSSGTGTDVPV